MMKNNLDKLKEAENLIRNVVNETKLNTQPDSLSDILFKLSGLIRLIEPSK